jgi:hypothetical protein
VSDTLNNRPGSVPYACLLSLKSFRNAQRCASTCALQVLLGCAAGWVPLLGDSRPALPCVKSYRYTLTIHVKAWCTCLLLMPKWQGETLHARPALAVAMPWPGYEYSCIGTAAKGFNIMASMVANPRLSSCALPSCRQPPMAQYCL